MPGMETSVFDWLETVHPVQIAGLLAVLWVCAFIGLIWWCPILKPYFGWRLPRREEWFQ